MPSETPDPRSAGEIARRAQVAGLYERHLGSFIAYARIQMGELLRAKETPDDLVQSVFREVLEGLDTFEDRGEAAFRNFIFARALGKIQNRAKHFRAQKRDAARETPGDRDEMSGDERRAAEFHASIASPSRIAVGREELLRVEAAFDRLPPDYREVIVLARIIGLGHAEIAARLGRSEIAVRTLLSRSLARLSTFLDA